MKHRVGAYESGCQHQPLKFGMGSVISSTREYLSMRDASQSILLNGAPDLKYILKGTVQLERLRSENTPALSPMNKF